MIITKQIFLKDLDPSFSNKIQNMINKHNVQISYYEKDEIDKPNTIPHKGSGTLVKIHDKIGILTAGHVIEPLNNKIAALDHTIQIPIKKRILDNKVFELEQYTVSKLWTLDRWETHRSKKHADKTIDIAFIELSEKDIDRILQLGKQILDLNKSQEKYKENKPFYNSPANASNWCWAINGLPIEDASFTDELTVLFKYPDVYLGGAIRTDENFILKHCRQKEFRHLRPDKLVFEINTVNKLPDNFNCVSGGGIWQISILDDEPNEFFFAGVFIASQKTSNETTEIQKKILIARGHESLYEIFYKYLQDSFEKEKRKKILRAYVVKMRINL